MLPGFLKVGAIDMQEVYRGTEAAWMSDPPSIPPAACLRVRAQPEVLHDAAVKPFLFPLPLDRTQVGSGSRAHVAIAHSSVAPIHVALVRTGLHRYRGDQPQVDDTTFLVARRRGASF